MSGDNKHVFDSTIRPHANLNKRHTELSFHRVWEDISSNMVALYHVYGEHNPDNIPLKNFSCSKIWNIFHPLMFWMGDTMELLDLKLRDDGGQ